MSTFKNYQNKNIFWLALTSAVSAVLFSFLSAPLLRAFSVAAGARVFWLTGTVLVAGLFVAGLNNTQISGTAVFVGAIWMTLGTYNEFEKRGINWKQSSLLSLGTGLLFAVASYYLVLKNLSGEDILHQTVEPLKQALTKVLPESSTEILIKIVPGILVASLFASLALGWAFESRAARAFSLKTERVVSRIRWLDFRLPDIAIWITLTALLVVALSTSSLAGIISMNVLVAVSVAYLFQGCTVVEFSLRYMRAGPIMRAITYILIILQLAPVMVFLGFVDYWADFRRLMRKKTKTKN